MSEVTLRLRFSLSLVFFSFMRNIIMDETMPKMAAIVNGMKNISSSVAPIAIIIMPEVIVAMRLPIAVHRLMAAFILPSLSEGTKSPIKAVHAGVAIEPSSAWIASRMIS